MSVCVVATLEVVLRGSSDLTGRSWRKLPAKGATYPLLSQFVDKQFLINKVAIIISVIAADSFIEAIKRPRTAVEQLQ